MQFFNGDGTLAAMRLHRFFIEQSVGDKKDITITTEPLIHQWKKVFRYKPGDQVTVFDNSGYEYTAQIEYMEPAEARLTVIESRQKSGLDSDKKEVHLYASLTKKDTFEWVLEKTTELGVTRITPVISERSEKKGLNFERAKKILTEASEQSGRVIVPRLYDITPFEDAITQYDMLKMAFDPIGVPFVPAMVVSKAIFQSDLIAVFIGPEGGWTTAELELFKKHNIPVYSLGPQILRAETASIAIMALLLLR